jgi:hypothetical protein
MTARIGNVIYWLGYGVAILLILADIAEWFGEGRYRSDGLFLVVVFAAMAAVSWLIGRTFRYVLAGR